MNDFYPGVDCEATLRLFQMLCPEEMTNLDNHLGPKECAYPENPDPRNKIGYKFTVPNDQDGSIAAARRLIKPDHPYHNLSAE